MDSNHHTPSTNDSTKIVNFVLVFFVMLENSKVRFLENLGKNRV